MARDEYSLDEGEIENFMGKNEIAKATEMEKFIHNGKTRTDSQHQTVIITRKKFRFNLFLNCLTFKQHEENRLLLGWNFFVYCNFSYAQAQRSRLKLNLHYSCLIKIYLQNFALTPLFGQNISTNYLTQNLSTIATICFFLHFREGYVFNR